MQAAARIFASGDRLALAETLARLGQRPFVRASGFIEHLPFQLAGWTQSRDFAPLPDESFRQWWARRSAKGGNSQ
jgi:L-lactate dehydrogenase complex protein LldF